jgi:ectoine hydroxylase-related dioxygenase (phytanoyl-CoA dioxygenase family)
MALLDPVLVQQFDRDGYVVTPGLLTSDELARYGTAIATAVARRTASDTRDVSEKSTYEQSFIQCMRLWETDAAVRPLTFHPHLAEAAAELLGVPAVRIWQDQALYKEPGGRITDPHQDSTFWPIGDAPLVSAWIPLEGSSRGAGAMGYVPGSHKAGRLKVVNLLHTTEPYDILGDPALAGREPVFVEAPVGSVVWHHGLTVHQAEPNGTDRMRRTFTVVYIADGSRREQAWDTFPLAREGIGVGELIEGPSLPIAWPREPGDLPDPPSALGEPTGPQVRVMDRAARRAAQSE